MSRRLTNEPIGGMTVVAFDGGPRGPCVQIDCAATLTQFDRAQVRQLVGLLDRWLTDSSREEIAALLSRGRPAD